MSGDGDASGARIARARRRRGLSQTVLAGLVGRSESWLSQVERGKRGVDSHAVLTRMAAVLRVEVEELTGPEGGDGEEGAPPPVSIMQGNRTGLGDFTARLAQQQAAGPAAPAAAPGAAAISVEGNVWDTFWGMSPG